MSAVIPYVPLHTQHAVAFAYEFAAGGLVPAEPQALDTLTVGVELLDGKTQKDKLGKTYDLALRLWVLTADVSTVEAWDEQAQGKTLVASLTWKGAARELRVERIYPYPQGPSPNAQIYAVSQINRGDS